MMSFPNIRPSDSAQLLDMAVQDLEDMHLLERQDTMIIDPEELEEHIRNVLRRAPIGARVLREYTGPIANPMENFQTREDLNNSVPSLDEYIIRQRGRPKKPAKIIWSPIKSPLFKTPTKNNTDTGTLHMSLLSPSPAKKLFSNSTNDIGSTSMVLRNSPRKRIFADADPTSSSTPYSTPTKRQRLTQDRPMSANNEEIPLKTLLKGLSHDQLINIIQGISAKDPSIEEEIRNNIPLPDIRPLEDELNALRKNITRCSPRSRLSMQSKTDGSSYTRASPHMTAFKKAIVSHCKVLSDSQHFDALIDYVLMAWPYVRGLPVWDEPSHNITRKDCFKSLTLYACNALKNGGANLGADRIKSFRNKFKLMTTDFEDFVKCKEALNALLENPESVPSAQLST